MSVKPADLAFTLSERRSRLFHRGYVVVDDLKLPEDGLLTGKEHSTPPKIGFILTGQGAQWPQMGRPFIDSISGSTLR